ncbi:MAG: DUF1549 and DUF1553 domain-containing protein [Gemmataceae bacterium]
MMTRRSLCLCFAVLLLALPISAQPKGDEPLWWSLRPLAKPAVPAVGWDKHKAWPLNPIDHFILATLKEKGLEPAPAAERRTLLRRVTFNLTGLPPTPDEMDAFLSDKAPDAYEKAVDRLLASPRYGERWARHWMDVIHFAETHGHDQDVPRDNAWPYRDYLIRAFNADKPYARFVKEQIAGDILFPDDPWATVALGFLAAGPWDESSLRDIREDTIDRTMGQYLDRDDMVTTVALTFLSSTVQCARCHDHKFDPVPTDEYYALQAVFAGVDRANRVYDEDPRITAERRRLTERKKSLDGGTKALAALAKDAAVIKEVQAWEAERRRKKEAWTVLDPTLFASDARTPAAKQSDLSVLFTGKPAEKDVYRFEAISPLPALTALRLETLTDDSLPHKGPGRQDNGNLHLSEIAVEIAPPGATPRKLTIARAVADFNQDGWDIGRAIDGKMETAWGIYPAVGKPHQGVFIFAEAAALPRGTKIVVTLHQQHGGRHLIGRVRLSITDAPAPSLSPVPADIDRILAKTTRSHAEQLELTAFVLRSKIDQSIATLPSPKLVYAATPDFTPDGSFRPAKGCRPVHILKRGDIRKPAEKAEPGGLSCVSTLDATFKLAKPADEGQRRAAFADWVASPRNMLTWRSIANRVWHYHFGRGIVSTPSDFGRMGSRPTHPELLDWLACYLLENDGSLKKLHRLIVTSAAYRQSSRHDAAFAKVDADNAFLWRMNRAKLDAESLRDAVLAVSGKIDFTMGGPSVKHFKQSPGIHRTPKIEYDKFDPDSPGAQRRSVYRFIFRTVPDPFMDALDCPDASQFTAVRAVSITPQQALALLNDPFMTRMSEHFAKRVSAAGSVTEQVRRAFELALGRPPRERELDILTGHARAHGMANVCRLLFNLNEFVFVN